MVREQESGVSWFMVMSPCAPGMYLCTTQFDQNCWSEQSDEHISLYCTVLYWLCPPGKAERRVKYELEPVTGLGCDLTYRAPAPPFRCPAGLELGWSSSTAAIAFLVSRHHGHRDCCSTTCVPACIPACIPAQSWILSRPATGGSPNPKSPGDVRRATQHDNTGGHEQRGAEHARAPGQRALPDETSGLITKQPTRRPHTEQPLTTSHTQSHSLTHSLVSSVSLLVSGGHRGAVQGPLLL
ncbi:hypothetical protein BKA56DRAFT_683531 [Ilyonectria sp. MPI-CAGE-AT-0026]|nr:hypothetical protein BKA56DRAFT_683531 [Ilyonectria sp. MPI-CAGE-AT-0026]